MRHLLALGTVALLSSGLAYAVSPEPVPLPPIAIPDARLDALDARLERMENQSGSQGLLNLYNQVEVLKAEVARLRGRLDELEHGQQQADKRQKDVLADYDIRLKEVRELARRPVAAPVPVAAPAVIAPERPAVDPEAETRAYEVALNFFKGADYVNAATAFNGFLDKYPSGSLAGNACYWLGLTYIAMGDPKSAAATQQRLLREYPQHNKVPDAMVSLARAQIQLGEIESARQLLDQVVVRYPGSRSAELAKKIQQLFK